MYGTPHCIALSDVENGCRSWNKEWQFVYFLSTMQLLNIDNYYRVNYEGVFAVINVLTYAHTYKFSMCLLCYT